VSSEHWRAQQRARRLAGDHAHVICTRPDERRGLWLAQLRLMITLLFATVHEPLDQRLGDETYLGAWPGLIAARHRGRQALGWHPHLPCG
jgi:hypothetical protein